VSHATPSATRDIATHLNRTSLYKSCLGPWASRMKMRVDRRKEFVIDGPRFARGKGFGALFFS
jgi:hypothetical protein